MLPLPASFIGHRSVRHFDRLQRIKRGAERVIRHVRSGNGVTGSARSRNSRFVFYFSRCRVRRYRGFLCAANRDFARGPCAACRDRVARARVVTAFFEKWKDALRAIGGPFGQEAMSREIERTPSMGSDKSLVSKGPRARNRFNFISYFLSSNCAVSISQSVP